MGYIAVGAVRKAGPGQGLTVSKTQRRLRSLQGQLRGRSQSRLRGRPPSRPPGPPQAPLGYPPYPHPGSVLACPVLRRLL